MMPVHPGAYFSGQRSTEAAARDRGPRGYHDAAGGPSMPGDPAGQSRHLTLRYRAADWAVPANGDCHAGRPFTRGGIAALQHRPRRHRTGQVCTPAIEQRILDTTLQRRSPHGTHWSVRTLARYLGLSRMMIQRVWQRHELQPHRVERFKLSKDPQFEARVRDIVGLYLNPPARALVLCVDEKSQIQALDRTAPSCRCAPDCRNGKPMLTDAMARRPCLRPLTSSPARSLGAAGRATAAKSS